MKHHNKVTSNKTKINRLYERIISSDQVIFFSVKNNYCKYYFIKILKDKLVPKLTYFTMHK